ncbi:MAG: DUF4340 domain-containing protein [Thiohalomonadales bacterium]
MNSRNTINIILFVFVTILVAIVFFDSEESTQTTFNLTTLSETEITSIEITRQTDEALKFKKNNDLWYMISPYKIRANTFYIESLLRITQAKSLSKFTISDTDKNKFKLNPAQASLKLNDQLFLFGTNEQLNLNRYILTNKKLYLILDRYFYLLNSTTTGFIDHALIGKNEKITGLKLVDYDLQLINDKWKIKPDSENIGTDDIIQLITEWNNSQAVEITKLTDLNNIKKNFSIELTLKNNAQTIVFDIIVSDDSYLFIRRDLKLQYKLNQEMANRLLKIPLND